MKKILFLNLVLFLCVPFFFAQDLVVEHIEEKMIMPDGATADIYCFKKWGDASKLANDKSQWKGKHSVLAKSKIDSDLGYGDIWHKSDDNEAIQLIYNVMEEHGSEYAVAFASFDKRIRRYVFTYKKGKLRNSFMDFFDESHDFYIACEEKDAAKQEKLNNIAAGITEAILSPLTAGAEAASNRKETPEQTLYRIRHHTYEITHQGSYKGSGIQVFKYRYIYRDDGRRVIEYIVDLDGNIRSDIGSVGTRNTGWTIDKAYPIVEKYSVPKEIRDLAMKSLE